MVNHYFISHIGRRYAVNYHAVNYHHAVNWLKKACAAYLVADRQAEWDKYLADLLTQHKRKYKLVPMLKELQ